MGLNTRSKILFGLLKPFKKSVGIPRKLAKEASGGMKETAPKGGSKAPNPVRTHKGM